jgi:Holliday junction resolvase YEN1
MAGVVDAVMSNDVDSLMFGSRVTIMNFSKESSTGTKAATHVNLYRAERGEDGREANVPLDRGGMILFALMSGGDYLPAGVPNCGPKLAAQIANAGFGADLVEIVYNKGADTDTELNKWRERLRHELKENESGYFRKRHRAVQIPDSFPDRKILSDYTHPIVSSTDQLELVRQSLTWDQNIDMATLWTFVSETLKWKHAFGAKKFVKAFAAPLVSHRLRLHLPLVAGYLNSSLLDIENSINPQIYKGRALYATDGLSELQLKIVPTDVVGLRFDCETTSPLRQKEEESIYESSDLETTSKERTPYDPTRRNKIWVFEAIAKLGIPDSVGTWEIAKQAKLATSQNPKPKNAGSRTKKKKPLDPGMREGEILRYGIITKGSVTELDAKITSTQKPAFSEHPSGSGSAGLSHISGVRHLKISLRDQVNNRTSCQANENIGNLPGPLVQQEQVPHSRSEDLRPETMVPYVTSSDLEAAMNVDYSDEGRSPLFGF